MSKEVPFAVRRGELLDRAIALFSPMMLASPRDGSKEASPSRCNCR
jgi:hypothetical protein